MLMSKEREQDQVLPERWSAKATESGGVPITASYYVPHRGVVPAAALLRGNALLVQLCSDTPVARTSPP